MALNLDSTYSRNINEVHLAWLRAENLKKKTTELSLKPPGRAGPTMPTPDVSLWPTADRSNKSDTGQKPHEISKYNCKSI